MTIGSAFKFTPTKDSSFFTTSCIWFYCHWILYSLYIMSSFANVFFVLTKTHFIKKWINKEQFKNASFKSDKQPPDVFSKKVSLRDVRKFHKKQLSDLKACRFIKKRIQRKCFPVKLLKSLRTSILKNICQWLLLLQQFHLH